MSQIVEYVKIALMNIKSNRGRSILTMLGIIIGISSVIMVITIGNGVRGKVNSEIESLGGGQIGFYVDSTRKQTTVSFDQTDFDMLSNEIDHIKGVTPYIYGNGTAQGPKGHFKLTMGGGNTGLQYYSMDPLVKGRYFTQSDYDNGSNTVIITESNANSLFGTTDVIGMTFEATLWGVTQDLQIVGIRKDSSSSVLNMMNTEVTINAEVPLTFMANRYGFYMDEFSDFYVFAESSTYCTEIAKKGLALLENRHQVKGENQIQVQNIADISAEYNSILDVITLFISFVAAIALVVGGIGVMNIMLVSVTERTREIGVRKALGARTRSILIQFLSEAGIITLLGGLIGIVLGISLAFLVCAIAGLKAGIDFATIIIATIFSCGIGLFFGIYPARRAAKLNPIEALRHE